MRISIAILLSSLLASVSVASEMPGPVPPDRAVATFKVYPGFKIELVAAEPLVTDPVAFNWSADGKLWVVEMGDYPLGEDGKGSPGGMVRCLEDLDGDGKYDKSTVFLDKLSYPNGVTPYRKGVLITAAPDIIYAEDTDGDGKADKRDVLFTGFKKANPQHRVHGFVYGLDNWFHAAGGDSTEPVKSIKTGETYNVSGRDLRIRPDTGELDPQSGSSQNPRTRDEWGNWFGCDNSNPSWQYVLDDHYLRRNPHVAPPAVRRNVPEPGVASAIYPISKPLERFNDPHTLNRFTSACGLTFYRDDLFGSGYRGNSFVSEPVHNLVHREIVWQDGLLVKGRRADDEHRMEFIASTDNWFRPTMLRTGPDGALYIADMYRLVIEHPQWIPKEWQEKLDLRSGHDKGRIYRVYPSAKPLREIPNLSKLDTAGLVAALDAPGGWQRDTAQQLLVERQDKAAVPLLEKLAATSQRALARLHALCTLDGLDSLQPGVLIRAMDDPQAGVRAHAVRLCETRLKDAPDLAAAMLKLVKDPDPTVRLQLAYTLGEWNDHRAGEALAAIALRDGKDPYISAAVMSSVNDANLTAVLAGVTSDVKRPPSGGLLSGLVRVAAATKNEQALATAVSAIVNAATAQNDTDKPDVAKQFASLAGSLDGLEQGGFSLAELSKRGPAVQEAVAKLSATFDAAREAAIDDTVAPEVRVAAVRLLGRSSASPDDRAIDIDILGGLLTPQTPEKMQTVAITRLARVTDADTTKPLLAAFPSMTPALRMQSIDAFLQRTERIPQLLNAIESKKVRGADLDASRRRQLLEHADESIRARAAKVFAGSINSDRQKVIDQYADALTLAGDAARGKEFFTALCAACHKVGDVGNYVGPDLLAVSDRSREYYLTHVLDPNRAVEGKFVNYIVETKRGETLAGVLSRETGNSITLTGADGKPQTVLRADLKRMRGTTMSAMPEGLEAGRTPQDFADLLAFLTNSAPPPQRKTFDGNKPAPVKPAADTGAIRLLPATAEIYGSTLVLEARHGNLGWWNSVDDHAVWSVEAPAAAGAYDVVLEWSCDDAAAGNTFVLRAGKNELTGKVAGTGGWDNYRKAKVGTINITGGTQRVTFRSQGQIKQALIDLKAIELVPSAGAAAATGKVGQAGSR